MNEPTADVPSDPQEGSATSPHWRLGGDAPWLYGDDPSPSNDLLDRRRLAIQLARAITSIADQSPSSVVALVGPWGSGKTTLLEQIKAVLIGEAHWCTASYNPWAYSTYEQAVVGFFQELAGAVPDGALGDAPRERIGKWVSRLSPLGALGGLINIDAKMLMEHAASLISGDQSPERLREKAADALSELDRPILVVLDDLDRLQPPELLLTFKLVRLLGRLPNVYYLLAYDEATLEDTLERTDLIGTSPGRARQYLEKMVQVRLEIPPMLDRQKIELMNMGLDDLCHRRGIEMDADTEARIQAGWTACLSQYMDQPRAIKLFFTQLDALWPEVEGEVEFADFLHITFLRRFEPRVFDLLLSSRPELLGQSIDFRKEAAGAKWVRWQGLVNACLPKYPEAIAELLAEVFMVVRGARDNMAYSNYYRSDVRRRFGVDCSEFFDRYVQVGVPQGDVSQADFVAAIEMLRMDVAEGGARIRQWIVRDPITIVQRLRDLGIARLPRLQMLLVLGNVYEEVSSVRSMLLSPGYSLRALGRELMEGCESSELASLIKDVGNSSDSGLTLVSDLVRAEGSDGQPRDEIADVRSEVARQLIVRIEAAGSMALEGDSKLVHDAWGLRAIVGPESVRELLWKVIRSTSAWTIMDLLGLMVPTGSTSDGRRNWASLGELSIGNIDDLLGIDRVLDSLPEGLPEPHELDEFDRRQADVTMEERKKYASRVMARERESRKPGDARTTSDASRLASTDDSDLGRQPD